MLMEVIFLLVFIRSVGLVDVSLILQRTDFPFSCSILLLSFEWVNYWTDVNWKKKQRKCYSAAKGISVVKAIHHFGKLSLLANSWFSQSLLTTVNLKPQSFTFLMLQRKQCRSLRLREASTACVICVPLLPPVCEGSWIGYSQAYQASLAWEGEKGRRCYRRMLLERRWLPRWPTVSQMPKQLIGRIRVCNWFPCRLRQCLNQPIHI